MDHAIAIEEMVGPTGEELRVWAVADVGAVEARREGAVSDGAFGGGELVGDRSEIVRQDELRVD